MNIKRTLKPHLFGFLCLVSIVLLGCGANQAGSSNGANLSTNNTANSSNSSATSAGSGALNIATSGEGGAEKISAEDINDKRMDQGWKQYVRLDSADEAASPNKESLAGITPKNVNGDKMHLPLNDGEGPSVLRAQILLDRSPFSPGILDGMWGKNTEKAVYWLQKREGMKATGTINKSTFKRLFELAGKPDKMIVEHKLTEKDVSGPFVSIPEDIYAQAKLDCMCYESLAEKLAEMFHIAPDLLQRLNPQAELNRLNAGDVIFVPNVSDNDMDKKTDAAAKSQIKKLIVSDGGHYIHAVDQNGKILYHFPSTLGSSYAPSPSGEWKINTVAFDPTWHYQPDLLTGVPDGGKDAIIPPGPNNPVGKVWIDLTKEHYGIHGTKAPETIGYATSHGCVRLTNWDAMFLANRVGDGTAVTFADTEKRNSGSDNSNSK